MSVLPESKGCDTVLYVEMSEAGEEEVVDHGKDDVVYLLRHQSRTGCLLSLVCLCGSLDCIANCQVRH